MESLGVKVIQVPVDGAQLDLPQVLRQLTKHSLTSVLVEGGAAVAASIVEQRLLDKVTFFFAPKIIGGQDAKSAIEGEGVARLSDALELRDLKVTPRGTDLEITGYPKEKG